MSRMKYAQSKARGTLTAGTTWLAGFALLGLLAAGIWFATQPLAESGPGTRGPRLAVNQDRLDLGKVPLNQTVRAEFTLTNQGDRTLQLDASTPVRVLEGC